MRRAFRVRILICFAVCAVILGCEPERPAFTEVKRIGERLTPAEWAGFVRVVEHLPDRRLPEFPQVLLSPPQWDSKRSLPIRELYDEELRRLEECWDPAHLGRIFERNRALERELKREEFTPQQFAGLVLTLGAALSRSQVSDDVDLPDLADQARPFLKELSEDETVFVKLAPDAQHDVLQKARWLARRIRADVLRQVPPENIALVVEHREWLAHAFPDEFLTDPLHELRDLLLEQGVPFEELPDSGLDEEIRFTPAAGFGSP
jgi:hypothetical protein